MEQLWAVAGAPLLATPGRRLEVDRLLDRVRSAHWTQEQRLYRVDAARTVLTSPLHWFRDIGHGFLVLEEANNASVLRFGATSSPEKAHGFDRTGFIEEASVDQEYAGFGFITAGHDSHTGSADPGFTAMDLYARGQQCWFKRAGVPADGQSRLQLDRLIGLIRGAFPQSGGMHQQVQLGGPHPTFLHAVLKAVKGPADRFHCTYVYNAKQFDLSVERHEDPRMASALCSRGLTKLADTIRRYEGFIKDGAGQSTNRQWNFRFWREEGTATRLPLRIEFQPKPILRLSLELTPLRTV